MSETLHSKQTYNHILENWTYADATARLAATGFTANDVGKISYQTDNKTYWRLLTTTPTWTIIGPNIPGLLGSPDISGQAGGGLGYEFDTTTDPFTWTAAAPTVHDSNTTIKSHYYIKETTTNERRGYASWSPAGAFDLRCVIAIGTDALVQHAIGLIIANAGDTSRVLIEFAALNTGVTQVTAFTYAGSYTNKGLLSNIGTEAYFRMVRDGSNNFSCYWSTTGKVWQIICAPFSFSLTVAQVGFYVSSPSSSASYAAVDWLRSDV